MSKRWANLTLVLEWAKFTEASVHGSAATSRRGGQSPLPWSLQRAPASPGGISGPPPKSSCQLGCTSAQGLHRNGDENTVCPWGQADLLLWFFFLTSYSLLDSRLRKKRRGHLNFTRQSTPHCHYAFDICLKWIKLTFHQQLDGSAEDSLFVTFQFRRDLGGTGRLLRRQTSFWGSQYWQKGFY